MLSSPYVAKILIDMMDGEGRVSGPVFTSFMSHKKLEELRGIPLSILCSSLKLLRVSTGKVGYRDT